MKKDKDISENKDLRTRAEAKLDRSASVEDLSKMSPEETLRLVHELQVHQLELEIQNEELRRAHLELEESRNRYSDLYDFAPIGYITVSAKGIIQEANLTICSMLGVERGSLVKKPFTRFITSETQDIFYLHRQKLFGTKTKQNCELKLLKKDGLPFDAQLECIVIVDERGNITQILTAITDIGDRKQMEKEKEELEAKLRQSQKMEAIGTLAGGICHDFNNLLMGIQGHTSLALVGTASSHPHYKHLKGIEDHVESAADLTKELLGFARGGKYMLKPTDLNEIVKKSVAMFGRTKKEIRIHIKSQKKIWTVEVDQGQIEQVLLNLYVNAGQAMSGSGDIYIETDNVTLDEYFTKPYGEKPGRYVKVSVTDTGVGMDETTQKRVFDPFFTTKEMSRGTGMGLASAFGIMKSHAGIITVYSQKGKGATFNIYLPVTDAERMEQIAGKEKSFSEILRGTETILLIDDEETVLAVGKDLLEVLGYTVLAAGSGREGLKIYKNNQTEINLVLLDMIMPDMDGSATYDRLKEFNPDIKVLLSSGYSINSPAKAILAKGCDGFIQKPFGLIDLSHKLREILDMR